MLKKQPAYAKVCLTCNEEKLIEEFRLAGSPGKYYRGRECNKCRLKDNPRKTQYRKRAKRPPHVGQDGRVLTEQDEREIKELWIELRKDEPKPLGPRKNTLLETIGVDSQ